MAKRSSITESLRTLIQSTYRKHGKRALTVTVICLGAYGGYRGAMYRATLQAEELIKKGFGTLAASQLSPFQRSLVSDERGCGILIASNFLARKSETLDWASQACLEAGINIPDAYIGLAAVREFSGQDNEALQILNQVASKFEKTPDIYLRMATIFRRAKNNDGAAQAYLKAAERAPQNNQLSLDILQFMSEQNRWQDALQFANKLRTVETDNAEVKLVIARALFKGGDQGSAKLLVDQAKALIEKKPEIKPVIERAYADVLNPPGAPQPPRNLASERVSEKQHK